MLQPVRAAVGAPTNVQKALPGVPMVLSRVAALLPKAVDYLEKFM